VETHHLNPYQDEGCAQDHTTSAIPSVESFGAKRPVRCRASLQNAALAMMHAPVDQVRGFDDRGGESSHCRS
jgi:hypothetical protein